MANITDPKHRAEMMGVIAGWGKPKRTKRNASPEKEIQHAVFQYLRAKNIFCWRNNTGVVKTDHGMYSYGSVGSPDIFCVVKGQLVGIEVKSSTGRQSMLQVRWQEELEKAGGIYLLARSVDDVIGKI